MPAAICSEDIVHDVNNQAAAYGVRINMKRSEAQALCPQMKIVPADFAKYLKTWRELTEILQVYDSNVIMNLSTASVDLSRYLELSLVTGNVVRDVIRIVNNVKEKIRQVCGITVLIGTLVFFIMLKIYIYIYSGINFTNFKKLHEYGVGVGPTLLVATLASCVGNPIGFQLIPPCYMDDFLKEQPFSMACDICDETRLVLKTLGIEKIGDVWKNRSILANILASSSLEDVVQVYLGVTKKKPFRGSTLTYSQDRSLQSVSQVKHIYGTSEKQALIRHYSTMCYALDSTLKSMGLWGKRILLELTTVDLKTFSIPYDSVMETNNGSEFLYIAMKLIGEHLQNYTSDLLGCISIKMINLKPVDPEVGFASVPRKESAVKRKALPPQGLTLDRPLAGTSCSVSENSGESREPPTKKPCLSTFSQVDFKYITCPKCGISLNTWTTASSEIVMEKHVRRCTGYQPKI